MDQNILATELLHEVKVSAKRWFIAFIIMVILEIGTVVGFLWYISLPVENNSIIQEQDAGEDNTMVGGNYNATSNN